jgi:outer membrane protein
VAELERKIAASGNYPDLSLNGSYSYSRNQSDAGILNLNESDGLSAGFSFSYPIFQGFQQDIRQKHARIRVESRKEELAEVEKQVRRDLLNAWENYRMRLKMLRMEERGVRTARKNFQHSRESYRVGRIDATRLREAQVNLIEARIRKLNSKFQAKTAEMELLKLAGGLNEKVGFE